MTNDPDHPDFIYHAADLFEPRLTREVIEAILKEKEEARNGIWEKRKQ